MFDFMQWIGNDDSPDAGADDTTEDDDPFGGPTADDDLDGLDGFADDDGFGDDDPFDEGDGGDGGAASAELENTVDELEEEVASLSSTVNTVRSENEEISETVGEVEENVRKLLDIYEMVTRGVNPFVDEAGGSPAGGDFDSDSFGLFDTGEEETTDEDLDEDVANAEADEFFDDDFVDPSDGGEMDDGPEMDAESPIEGSGDGFGDDLVDEDEDELTADGAGDDDGGQSFSELKEKYESGEADWADEDLDPDADEGGPTPDAGEGDGAQPVDADGGVTTEPPGDGELDGPGAEAESFGPDAEGALGDDALDAADVDDDPGEPDLEVEVAPADDPPADPGPGAGTGGDAGDASETGESTERRPAVNTMNTKPYLVTLPGGYVSDLLVMEWLEYLVEASDMVDTAKAIDYYERVDWIDEDVADGLFDYLEGFGDPLQLEFDSGPPTGLTIDHHTESLWYISRLAREDTETLAFERLRRR